MSSHDLARELGGTLSELGAAIAELHRHMSAGRTAYVAAKPNSLEALLEELDGLAGRVSTLEQRRADLCRQLCEHLGLDPTTPIRIIADRIGGTAGGKLAECAAGLADAAKSLRVESRVGGRILEFASNAHESIIRDLLRLQADKVVAYDRHARVHGDPLQTGSIVTGTI